MPRGAAVDRRVSTPAFAVNFDYRCPFARIVHQYLIDGLEGDAEWDVAFVPFSLSQAKVEPGEPDMWDAPERDSGLLALQVGVAVRDGQPDRFLAVHRALFAFRHELGGDLRDEDALRRIVADAGADVDATFEAVRTGGPLAAVRDEHTWSVKESDVWGTPTFLAGGSASFVRLMAGPRDAQHARDTVERLVEMLTEWPELNEFKHTSLER